MGRDKWVVENLTSVCFGVSTHITFKVYSPGGQTLLDWGMAGT